MAEEKTSERDLAGEKAVEQAPEESRTERLDQDRVVAFVIRRETAIDLLNALTTALGGLPDSTDLQDDIQGDLVGIELAGDSTLGSDR